MDSLALVRMRVKEIIDAKLERLKQIDEERESILAELEEARRMLVLPEEPKPEPVRVKRKRTPMIGPVLDRRQLIEYLRSGPKSKAEIATKFGLIDGRSLITVANMTRWNQLRKLDDGRYELVI